MSVSVAQLGLGCWAFGGKGEARPDDQNSLALLARAEAWGVVHWDTAQDYGAGHSETVLGRYLADHPGVATVATKAAFSASRDEVRARVERSLERLQVPAIDVFYIHWPSSGQDPATMVEALEDCRSRGLIRRIGVSNFSVAQMQAARRGGTLDDHQLGYSLAWRVAEDEVIPYCRENDIAVTVYSPLAQGLLSSQGRDPDRWGPTDPRRKTVFYLPDVWPKVERVLAKMEAVASEGGVELSDLALRWVLTRPGISTVLVGASTEAQLRANVETRARAYELTAAVDALDELSRALASELPAVGNMFLYYP